MKLGDLIDAIRDVERKEAEVADRERLLEFGGDEGTMRSKRKLLNWALADLAALREAEIEL